MTQVLSLPQLDTSPAKLVDHSKRQIKYLRLSLTSACQMRCTYCRPAVYDQPAANENLSADHFYEIAKHLAENHGVNKIRITGGDPTARKDLLTIIEKLASIHAIDDLAMSTNALTLAKHAQDFRSAGLDRINISLDSLEPKTFHEMTGVDGLHRVLSGIDKAQEVGLRPIKINTVVMQSFNDFQLPDLMLYAASRDLEIRFIELMPMGPLAGQWSKYYVAEKKIWELLRPFIHNVKSMEQGHAAAKPYLFNLINGQQVKVGFITPMSCNFCASCTRLRITAQGNIYPCLMDEPAGHIRDAFEGKTFNGRQFDQSLQNALNTKAKEHPHDGPGVMTNIGG